MMRRPKKDSRRNGKRAPAAKEGRAAQAEKKGGLASGDHAGRLLPVRRLFFKMKIVVQNRKTNAFLTEDAKWVKHVDCARGFATSLEALRFCAERDLRETDMLVCFSGAAPDLRVPLF